MQLNDAIRRILSARGIVSETEINEFFSDKPTKFYDPFLLHDMEAGVDLILSSIDEGRKLCVYGDYDTDGVTSVSLLMDVLKALNADVSYYIPSRFDEGYGLNKSALLKIKEAGADLVITVDCGCTSVDEVEYAKEIGLDIMITDHHAIRENLPDCIVIDPQRTECQYPFKLLAGVGVAFKLAQALCETSGLPKRVLTRNLDLVGIGTIGDIVPLIDENRTLAKYGLRSINITERPGLNALIEGIGLKKGEIDARQLSFMIVPHINAAGRMGDAALAARLMQTKDAERAKDLVVKLKEANALRKQTQEDIYKECAGEVEREKGASNFIFVQLDDAHEGVTGIVAGRLKETFGKPAFVLTKIDEEHCKGTCRSIEGINIFKILSKCGSLFERFGGHAAACGFTVRNENIEAVKSCISGGIEKALEENREDIMMSSKPETVIDSFEIDEAFLTQQKLFEPCGKDNPQPLVMVELQAASYNRMGADNKYLKLSGELSDRRKITGVDFRNADRTEDVIKKAVQAGVNKLNVIGHVEEQTWKDRKYLQVLISNVSSVESE